MQFSKTDKNVLYLYNYFSVRYKEHSGISEKILLFKEGDLQTIDYFVNAMSEAMDSYYGKHMDYLSNMLICVVPSHAEGKYSPGLLQMARILANKYGMTNASNLIKRTKTHEKKSQGGNRDIDVMLDTLDLNHYINIFNKDIIVLDDVTTTGNSIEAVRHLLKENGANRVFAQTLGKSVRGTFKLDYVVEYPGFEIQIETEQNIYPRTLEGAKEVLKKYFGYDSFRNGQESIIKTLLNGEDALAIMPTGAGKSICYQVPALMLDGITIVVSPLISLMQDQVKALNSAGIRAAFINSSLDDSQITTVLNQAQRGAYKIIYVAPERLESSEFQFFSKDAKISMVTIDEAHCISQWGQDFRPSYLKIIDYIKSLKKRPVVSAFTATATEEVKNDIICTLNLIDPNIVVTGFNRENLYFSVESGVMKDDFIMDYIEKHPGDSGIIYCSTRKSVDALFELLFKAGISVTKYHAGLSSEERKKNQDDFIYDNSLIVVATNAFGMGIDKSNVRFVIHYNMPQSMENYYQEAGRAGRDGERSNCIMLYSPQDVMTQKWLLDHKEFVDIPYEDIALIKERDIKRLHIIENYCRTTGCLRNYILNYFGEEGNEPCDDCGNCHREYKEIDLTNEAKQVANCVYETKGRYGITIVIGTLIGANRARIRDAGADKYRTYGTLKGTSEAMVRRLITHMIQEEYLNQTDERYSVLKFGSKIDELRKKDTRVCVRYYEDKAVKASKIPAKVKSKDALTNTGYDLFEKLRTLRLEIAREEAMPPYIIFNDKTLIQMCLLLPQSKREMLNVSGVGEAKYDKYGERFIAEIEKFIEENDKPISYVDISENPQQVIQNDKTKKKKKIKVKFYLTEEQANGFKYEESLSVGEIREKLNELRDSTTTKVVRSRDINEFVYSSGYVSEEFVDGIWRKVISETGLDLGIHYVKHVSSLGNEYYTIAMSDNAQKLIVQNFVADVPVDNEEEEVLVEDTSKDSFDRAEYNKSKNRPEGAGRSWTEEEEKQLREEFESGMKIGDLAIVHSRTRGGIRARLKRMGLID